MEVNTFRCCVLFIAATLAVMGNVSANWTQDTTSPMNTSSQTKSVAQASFAQATVLVNIWVLDIEVTRDDAADPAKAELAARAADLPFVVGSRADVRALIGKLTLAGLLKKSREFRLTPSDGQPAVVRTGANAPQVTRLSQNGADQINQLQYRPVGTAIQAQARRDETGHITLNLNYEHTEIERRPPSSQALIPRGGPAPATPDQIATQSFQSVFRLRPGTAVVAQKDTAAEPSNSLANVRTQLIIVGATVIPGDQ